MADDEIHLYNDADYKFFDIICYTPTDRLLFKRVKRSHETNSDIILIL